MSCICEKKKGNKLQLTFCWLIGCCFVPFPCIFLNEVQIYWQPSFFDSGDTHTPPVSLRVSDQTHPGPHILQLLEKLTRPTKITPTKGITVFQFILSSKGSCRPSEGSLRPHAIFFCYTRLTIWLILYFICRGSKPLLSGHWPETNLLSGTLEISSLPEHLLSSAQVSSFTRQEKPLGGWNQKSGCSRKLEIGNTGQIKGKKSKLLRLNRKDSITSIFSYHSFWVVIQTGPYL